MNQYVDQVKLERSRQFVMLLEYDHTYTCGVNYSDSDNIGQTQLKQAARGGKITYHGPGQAVLYCILDIRLIGCDVRGYVDLLQNLGSVILSSFGVNNITKESGGLWVNGSYKISSIGVRISQYVASYGIAINLHTELDYFKNIIACGIKDCLHTSVLNETGKKFVVDDIDHRLIQQMLTASQA